MGDIQMATTCDHLLKPTTIGTIHIKNRIVMAPMNTGFAGPNGEVTDKMISYYEKRAKHGVGLIVVEATGVVPDVKNMACQPRLSDDAYIPGFSTLVERIKAYGVKTFLQIQHSGNEAAFGKLVSASKVGSKAVGGVPEPLTIIEIEDLCQRFIETAERAYRAGFDGVEIHAAHGYLLNQFISPFFNQRTDIYGGSITNRARIIVDIIKGVKSRLESRFVTSVRYSAKELIEGGLDVEEAVQFAKHFQEAGADSLHIASGIYDSGIFISGPASVPQGMFVPTAREIKQAVDIPVIVVGRINDPLYAEKVLNEGSADMIAFGRAFLGDPKFPEKIYENRPDEIRKCIGCRFCGTRVSENLDVRCAVNVATGREQFFPEVTMTRNPQHIVVVGGGPAGVEAAISAKKMGHQVTLLEKADRLGGQLNLAIKPPFKEVHHLLNYQKNKIKALGITVKLNMEVNRTLVENMNPDVVLVATGAKPKNAPFPTKECQNLMSAWEALAFPEKIGEKVVIIGGGSVGCETAEYLAGKNVEIECQGMKGQGPEIDYKVLSKTKPAIKREITIIELVDEMAVDEEWGNRALLLIRLKESEVRMITKAKPEMIRGNTITYHEIISGKTKQIEADTFIISTGIEPEQTLINELSDSSFKIMTIGDCTQTGTIKDAIYSAALAVRQLN
jgi:2,4-dienoyl-CoA reductase-like NADH-dependent reductase (Old Yellow Enzyme family)/thioredoxin reductase